MEFSALTLRHCRTVKPYKFSWFKGLPMYSPVINFFLPVELVIHVLMNSFACDLKVLLKL